MSKQNNKGGLLDQLAEKPIKRLVDESVEQPVGNSVRHERFGLIKRRYKTTVGDVAFARLSLTGSVSFLMLAFFWRSLMNSRFTLREQFAHPSMVLIVVLVHIFCILLMIFHLFLMEKYNVTIYEEGVEFVGTRSKRVRSFAYNAIVNFQKRNNYFKIETGSSKKLTLNSLTVAKVKEVGNTLDIAIKDSGRSK